MKENQVYTKNRGWLTTENGFIHTRGKKGLVMGFAKDDRGVRYKVVVDSCGLSNCNCAAYAHVIKGGD